MRGKSFDPRHLDVEAFAERSGALDGQLPLAGLRRLTESAHPEAPPGPQDVVTWKAEGCAEPSVARACNPGCTCQPRAGCN